MKSTSEGFLQVEDKSYKPEEVDILQRNLASDNQVPNAKKGKEMNVWKQVWND